MIPVYIVEEKNGPDHEPEFKVTVSINSQNYAYGLGSSTQKAQEMQQKSLKIWRLKINTKSGFIFSWTTYVGKSTLINHLLGQKFR